MTHCKRCENPVVVPDEHGFCVGCSRAIEGEALAGLPRLQTYLLAWALFQRWLADHDMEVYA